MEPIRGLCFWTACLKPQLPHSSSPSIRKTMSPSSFPDCKSSPAAKIAARQGPLLSLTPRP